MGPSLHLSCPWTKGAQRSLSMSLIPNWQELVEKGAGARNSSVDTARCHRGRSPGQGWVLVRALDSLFQLQYCFCVNSPFQWGRSDSVLPNISPPSGSSDKQGGCFICDTILVFTRRTKDYFHGKPWCSGVSSWGLQLEQVCLDSALTLEVCSCGLSSWCKPLFPKPIPIFPSEDQYS